jgi:hypothetical protein
MPILLPISEYPASPEAMGAQDWLVSNGGDRGVPGTLRLKFVAGTGVATLEARTIEVGGCCGVITRTCKTITRL